ncbi:MAG: DEAD/DEAH box helicase family protein, partial [Gammaproteobacteria bacterium]|nr:DEAD/DEAH box helicase family protein [Gammaproteobacteria bacterium]
MINVLRAKPRSWQIKALKKLAITDLVSLRSPRGCGKSTVAAWSVLWAVLCFPDVKVVTTALAWHQLKRYFWPEVHKWLNATYLTKFGFELKPGDNIQSQAIVLTPNRMAYAVASKEPERIEGAHADLVLFIFDEAKKIPDPIWDSAIMGSLGNEFKAFAVSTPGLPVGRFYDTQVGKDPDWEAIHVTKAEAELEVPGWKKQAERLRIAHGENSVVYRQHVMGEFAQDDEDSLIPLHLIEAAMERWEERKNNPHGLLYRVGVDVGGSGGSDSVIASRYTDNWIPHLDIVTSSENMTDKTAFAIQGALKRTDKHHHSELKVVVDAAGVGMGVGDVSKSLGAPVHALYVSSGTKELDATGTFGFNNERTKLLWRLYERLNPDITPEEELLCLPPDDELMGDLVAVKKIPQAGGYKAESKEQVKRRIGR